MVSASLAACLPGSAAVLVAGWDAFSGSTDFAPTQTSLGTTANIVATATVGNWDQWNNANGSGLRQGASVDGTFGGFVGATASIVSEASGSNLALSRSDGILSITLTNNSGSDQIMDGFHFDGIRKNNNGAEFWTLGFSGAISGTTTTAEALNTHANMPDAPASSRDNFVDLSTLADPVWENGQDITLSWTFTGSSNEGTSNGNELLLDNISVTVVPEPSSLLLGLGGFALVFRRRR